MTQDSLWADTHDLAPIFQRIQERHYPLMEDVEAIERICGERDEAFMWMEEKLARIEAKLNDDDAFTDLLILHSDEYPDGMSSTDVRLAVSRYVFDEHETSRDVHADLIGLQMQLEDALSLAPENVERVARKMAYADCIGEPDDKAAFAEQHWWSYTSGAIEVLIFLRQQLGLPRADKQREA